MGRYLPRKDTRGVNDQPAVDLRKAADAPAAASEKADSQPSVERASRSPRDPVGGEVARQPSGREHSNAAEDPGTAEQDAKTDDDKTGDNRSVTQPSVERVARSPRDPVGGEEVNDPGADQKTVDPPAVLQREAAPEIADPEQASQTAEQSGAGGDEGATRAPHTDQSVAAPLQEPITPEPRPQTGNQEQSHAIDEPENAPNQARVRGGADQQFGTRPPEDVGSGEAPNDFDDNLSGESSSLPGQTAPETIELEAFARALPTTSGAPEITSTRRGANDFALAPETSDSGDRWPLTTDDGIAAQIGEATTIDYRGTFFTEHPELKGLVVVHHAVERQAARIYPDIVTELKIHSLENLRGIPKGWINSRIHLSEIRIAWNVFYKQNPNATLQDLLDQATINDHYFGMWFTPQIG